MIKVLFVCHGNICRSTMAEYVFKDLVNKKGLNDFFKIDSCGTSREEIGNDIHNGTKKILKKNNIPFDKRKAKQITLKNCEEYDYLICMDQENINNVLNIYQTKNKVFLLLDFAKTHRDICDPWYTGDFQQAYNDISLGCLALIEHIMGIVEDLIKDKEKKLK